MNGDFFAFREMRVVWSDQSDDSSPQTTECPAANEDSDGGPIDQGVANLLSVSNLPECFLVKKWLYGAQSRPSMPDFATAGHAPNFTHRSVVSPDRVGGIRARRPVLGGVFHG